MTRETFTSIVDLRMVMLLDDLNRSQLAAVKSKQEWNGSPCPIDPDNYWIDDDTMERVNAVTGERTSNNSEFVGFHKFRADDGSEYGSFEVFFNDGSKEGTMELEKDWYWWACSPGCLPDSSDGEPANGPFPTAEGAYLDALEGGHG